MLPPHFMDLKEPQLPQGVAAPILLNKLVFLECTSGALQKTSCAPFQTPHTQNHAPELTKPKHFWPSFYERCGVLRLDARPAGPQGTLPCDGRELQLMLPSLKPLLQLLYRSQH
jgi:hypothetical protein